MSEQVEFEALLTKLRESRLSTDERRTTLDTLREQLVPLVADIFDTPTSDSKPGLTLVSTAISDGPNDVRRVILQAISSHLENTIANATSDDQASTAAQELTKAIETFLRSTLKIQSSRAASLTQSRSGVDVSSLPTSTLRAMAAALKTLHSLLRITPKHHNPAGPSRSALAKSSGLTSLFDVLLPCFSAGLLTTRHTPASIPRSQSSLQSGAFAWGEQPRRTHSSFSKNNSLSVNSSNGNAIQIDYSSVDEIDRKSGTSESERSDFSIASATSTRSRKDESRQQEATSKLIRQNSLHCFTELNRLESRALISRWGDLLPDQPATSALPTAGISTSADRPAFGRLSTSQSTLATPFSLCTIITTDPSTSVRIAAISALSSILSHGTLQFSMAQERSQRTLSFTSLSSQLAGWIVNIRSYLVVALQRATSGGGYPSNLAVALLGLVRMFVIATGKAKLLAGNEVVLGPAGASLVANKDPDVQAAAKRTVGVLTAAPNATMGRRQVSGSTPVAAANDQPNPAGADQGVVAANMTAFLGEGAELTPEICERVLAALEAADDPIQILSTWSILVKSLAETPSPILNTERCARLKTAWRRLSTSQSRSVDQQCGTLSSTPDLCKALSTHAALDTDASTSVLDYVRTSCGNPDEAVRAAAVRVLGLLVLPLDTIPPQTSPSTEGDGHLQRVAALVQAVLWDDTNAVRNGALYDTSSLVRQRAAWTFSNAMEARLRTASRLDEHEWTRHARYCLEAGKDIEGVAVSACRASGSLLAMLPSSPSSEACSLGRNLLEQLCKVLGTTSKPPKSRWNAASALDKALCSDNVLENVLELPTSSEGKVELVDRIIELLCSNLNAKVFKIRVSAANALLSLCFGADKAVDPASKSERLGLLGTQRCTRIQGFATARFAELNADPSQSKESTLYLDELKRLLTRLASSFSP